jgi:hypothetical protein
MTAATAAMARCNYIIHRFHPSFDGATPFRNEQRRT